ncbi:MAG TPA: hypothetical protein VGE01_04590 [Fimbriimonas sp.]
MNPQLLRILGWAIPVICMAGGSYATYSQYSRLQTAKESQAAAELDRKRAEDALTLARKQVEEAGRYAAEPSTDFEGTLFLNDLRLRAQKAGVQIASWKTTTAPASAGAGSDEKRAKLLEGIDRVSSELVLDGSYQAGRAFVEDLTRTERLYTINSARWNRGAEGGTQLTITVSRYVMKPSASTPTERT